MKAEMRPTKLARAVCIFLALPGCDQPSTPEEKAADAACSALASGDLLGLDASDDFALASVPAVYKIDFSTAQWRVFSDLGGSGGEYWCHRVGAAGPDPLNKGSFANEEGEVETFIVSAGIDDLLYYGTDEIPADADYPGSPRIASVASDVSDFCPQLPTVWAPAWGEYVPISTPLVCMRHDTDAATVVFVQP